MAESLMSEANSGRGRLETRLLGGEWVADWTVRLVGWIAAVFIGLVSVATFVSSVFDAGGRLPEWYPIVPGLLAAAVCWFSYRVITCGVRIKEDILEVRNFLSSESIDIPEIASVNFDFPDAKMPWTQLSGSITRADGSSFCVRAISSGALFSSGPLDDSRAIVDLIRQQVASRRSAESKRS